MWLSGVALPQPAFCITDLLIGGVFCLFNGRAATGQAFHYVSFGISFCFFSCHTILLLKRRREQMESLEKACLMQACLRGAGDKVCFCFTANRHILHIGI